MADVVVTVPKALWAEWIAEGDLAGEPWTGRYFRFSVPTRPDIGDGERVYIVAHGRLRGYAPLITRIKDPFGPGWALIRGGGAVAATIPEPIKGFRGFRYRFWPRELETPFPAWRTP